MAVRADRLSVAEMQGLEKGRYLLLKRADQIWHQRFLCAKQENCKWALLDPDGHVAIENLDMKANSLILGIKLCGPRGGLPVGVQGDNCYLFGDKLDSEERDSAYSQGTEEVQRVVNMLAGRTALSTDSKMQAHR